MILRNQKCFDTEEGYEELLKAVSDTRLVETLRTKWEANPSRSSEDKWSDLLSHKTSKVFFLLQHLQTQYLLDRKGMASTLEDIILQYTYPRIDAEVSKHRNHLLKAPFCVHPKTGRICVPLDPASIDAFDPEGVPTVGQLLQELDLIARPDEEAKNYNSGMCESLFSR